MIAFAFLLSSVFSSSRTAVVAAFIYLFASGLIGSLLLEVSRAGAGARAFPMQAAPYMGLCACINT
jgi:hypothetical protein